MKVTYTASRMFLMALLLLLLLMALLFAGCGASADLPGQPVESVTIEQAAVPTVVGGFHAEDLPTDPGASFVYMANIPGSPTDVSFNLDGPWDFTRGDTAATLTIAFEDTKRSLDKKSFPDADLVAVSSWKSNLPSANRTSTTRSTASTARTPARQPSTGLPGGLNIYSPRGEVVGQIHYNNSGNVSAALDNYSSTTSSSGAFGGLVSSASVGTTAQSGASGDQYGEATDPMAAGTEYNYQQKSDDAWLSFGRLGPEERLRSYSGGVSVLKFPMGVGSTWTENYSQIEDGQTIDISAMNTVLSQGRVRVPAGAFNDCYLLQNKVTVTAGRESSVTWDYIWFVPGVGRVAEVISQPAEKDDVFKVARSFYRLQEYHLP